MNDEAIPAATLIVVRDAASGPPELLMVERAGGMAFAAGALVFPGGRIDESDRQLASDLGFEASVIAAIRETVEETAIPVGLSPIPDASTARQIQDALVSNRSLGEVLRELGLILGTDALTAFSRWIPKFHAVRRFDTLFFIAKAPPGNWRPRVIEDECSGAFWVSAEEVLERDRNGTARLIFPTRRTLERLAQHQSFEAIRADAMSHPIEPVTPWVEDVNGEQFITIPDHLGYPVTRERLNGLWRG